MTQSAGNHEGQLKIPASRKKIHNFLTGRFYTLVMALATLLALFMTDAARIFNVGPGHDPILHLISLIILILFFVDLLVNCLAGERLAGDDSQKSVNVYIFSLLFWLDFLAMISMIPDIPWLCDFFLAAMGIPTAAFGVLTVSKLGRAAKAGARAARLVRALKFFTRPSADDGNAVTAMAHALADRALQKSVVMIMVIMIALPLLSSLDAPAEIIRLEMLEASPSGAEAFLRDHANVIFLNLNGNVLVDKKVEGYRPNEIGHAKTAASECRYVMRMRLRAEAIFDSMITLLIVIMLAIGGWAFRRDAEKTLAHGRE